MIIRCRNILNDYGKNDIICVPTNGFLKKNGDAVMGRGFAKTIARMFPHIPSVLGDKIKKNGSIVQVIDNIGGATWVSFPTKPKTLFINDLRLLTSYHRKDGFLNTYAPGWMCCSMISIIEASCQQLCALLCNTPYNRVLVPKPGCGNGELSWDEVEPILSMYFTSDKIIIYYL